MTLTPTQIKVFYDRFGLKQDRQAFYEDVAFDALVAHAQFEQAAKVFELGCGTGRFAHRLLQDHLPPGATYHGIDISETMVALAHERLQPFTERCRVVLSDGAMAFPLDDQSVDRVVIAYVLDLLSEADIRQALVEAQRVLTAEGKLCLISLTHGSTVPSRLVSAVWSLVYRLHAVLVGGCRPIRLEQYLARDHWAIDYRQVVTPFGVPSEILIASPLKGDCA